MSLDGALREKIVARLRDGLHPEAIYLFGSHAYGSPGPDSDIDLLVAVNESSQPHDLRAAAARRLLRGVPAAIDLRVVTREEFAARMSPLRSCLAMKSSTGTDRGTKQFVAVHQETEQKPIPA